MGLIQMLRTVRCSDNRQRVEAHRRRGHISRAKLFGDRKIKDEPPLIYLVAPTLRVHPSFNTLARSIAPDIEIYRFDINEDCAGLPRDAAYAGQLRQYQNLTWVMLSNDLPQSLQLCFAVPC